MEMEICILSYIHVGNGITTETVTTHKGNEYAPDLKHYEKMFRIIAYMS